MYVHNLILDPISGCCWKGFTCFATEHLLGLELVPWLPFSYGPLERNLRTIRARLQAQSLFLGVGTAIQLCFVLWMSDFLNSARKSISVSQCSPGREVRQAFIPILQMRKGGSREIIQLAFGQQGTRTKCPDSQPRALTTTQLSLTVRSPPVLHCFNTFLESERSLGS